MRRNQEQRAQFERNRLHRELQSTVERECRGEELRRRQSLAQERVQLEQVVRDARIRDMV